MGGAQALRQKGLRRDDRCLTKQIVEKLRMAEEKGDQRCMRLWSRITSTGDRRHGAACVIFSSMG
jgi:hypothetical protein